MHPVRTLKLPFRAIADGAVVLFGWTPDLSLSSEAREALIR